jgi:flagellar hook protein FlgE
MMTQAFYTGVAGLKTNSGAIDVVSDNLANINTVGFRGNEYEFSSLFESAINTDNSRQPGVNTIGVGSRLQSTTMMDTLGTVQLTDSSTDMVIRGNGWFGVEANTQTEYTKNGNFHFDANSDLVTSDGYYVLGTMGGNIDGEVLTNKIDEVALGDVDAQEKLRFPNYLEYPPEPTTQVEFLGNIGTADEIRTMSAGVVDPQNNQNELKLTYTKAQPQTPPGTQWNVEAQTMSLDRETIYDTQNGVVSFDEAGALVSSSLTAIDNNGASVNISLGEGLTGVTAISNLDITASSTADGTIGGELEGYDISSNGEVIATFSNGIQSSVGKIAVYHFQNDQGLNRISGTRFSESSNSGAAIFYKDSQGNNITGAEISNYQLEGSNVSMATGLTDLIILQRAYDANSKSITTADQMLQKALEMDA